MTIQFIDLKTPYKAHETRIRARMDAVLEHGQYIMGPEVAELEQQLADYVGVKHCISASSGTDTLLIAMMAMGIGAGDEVITTPFTFVSTGEMIALVGAKPVLVDIDPLTYNIDPAKIEAAITPRTKAIMPVSLYGQCADFDAINAIADRHGLAVIEDGAQSFGATYKGRRSCGLSTIGSTSFFPSKPLGAYGDGGALFTNDDSLSTSMRQIRVHGQEKRYYHARIGLNGRLDTLQAAIVLAKLEVFDLEVEQRARIGQAYSELIKQAGIEAVTPALAEGCTSVYAQYSIQVKDRDAVIARLNAAGVPTAVHYPIPLHRQPAFEQLGHAPGDFPVSEAVASRILSLPMHPYLGAETQQQVVQALTEAVKA
jgi:UDP-2-acetamido-2-deoxy-ribo-hexuluronate aminotransferase